MEVEIRPVPFGLADSLPFDEDRVHDTYDPDAVVRFWHVLGSTERCSPGARTPFPAFYSYTAPESDGLNDQPLEPAEATWQDTGSGSLAVLRYDAVREAAEPASTLLAFYESAYQAGARTAAWNPERFARTPTRLAR